MEKVPSTGRLPPALMSRLAAAYEQHDLNAEADRAVFLAARGGDFKAVVTSAAVGIDGALMAALPELRVISSFGVGLDKIDLAAAHARGLAAGYPPFQLTRNVSGARLGLVGIGRIGRTIAQRSTGFEIGVRHQSRRPVADVPWTHEPSPGRVLERTECATGADGDRQCRAAAARGQRNAPDAAGDGRPCVRRLAQPLRQRAPAV